MNQRIERIALKYRDRGIEMVMLRTTIGTRLLINSKFMNEFDQALAATGIDRIDDMEITGLDTYDDPNTGKHYKVLVIDVVGLFRPITNTRIEFDI